MAVTDISPEVQDLAVALGVLEAGGGLRPEFFANPLGQAAGLLRDPARRAALGHLIDALVPQDPAAPTDHAAGERWHLLADAAATARVYLTTRPTPGSGLALGLAVRVGSAAPTGGAPTVALTVAVGLLEAADSGLRSVVGTLDGPVRARLEVTADPDDAGFEAISIDAALTPSQTDQPVTLSIAVRGLRVDGAVLPPVVVDPTHLGPETVPLLQGLLENRLAGLAATDAPSALVALADHLLPLLGLAGDVPRLPVERIGQPGVVGAWFAQVLDAVPPGGGTAGSAWLGHLAGLLGSDAPPTGTGSEAAPLRVPVAALGGDDRIEITLATRTTAAGRELLAGMAVRMAGSGGIALDAGATLVSLPLTGAGAPRAAPAAAVLVRAPADPSAALVAADELQVGFARAGLRWDGTELLPLLELGAVTFDGHSYDLIDLAHVDSVRAAAADAVRAALADALGGDGPGARLAVLLGLLAPAGEADAPLADPVALLTGPTRELARVHRARLTDPGHSWAAMLAELAALLGTTDPVAGAGSAADPWHVPVASADPLSLELTAWTAGPVPELHLGLRVAALTAVGMAWVSATAAAEIVALTLPAASPMTAQLVAHHAVHLALTGPFNLYPLDGAALTLEGADARLDWRVGQSPEAVVQLTGLTVHLDDADVTLPALRMPPAAGFAPDQPDLGLGVPVADLDRLVRALLARLWQSRAGDGAQVASGLLGLTPLAGLPDDWPGLALPAGGLGELLSDPLEALRQWLVRLALEQSAGAAPFAWTLLDGLRRLVRPDATTADVDVDVPGAGTWSAPWRIELGAPGASQLLLWLDPDGPPEAWTTAAAAQATQADTPDLLAIMGRFGASLPPLAAVFGGPDGPAQPDRLAAAFAAMVRDRSDGDGVVPLIAQLPDDAGWAVAGTLVDAAHHRLPEHSDAVAQVLAQVDAWAPGPDRAVVLIGPPFTDRSSWQPLLAAAEAARPGATDPGAHFDLRTPPSPDRAALAATTAAVSWYTADLADPGGPLGAVVDQIAAVVGRVRELRGDSPVVLVAHSTAGLAARAFAAAHPQLLAGLITIGTPHGPAPLTVLDDPAEADALRLAARLLDAAGVTGPLRDALDHLLAAAEGWQATTTLPTPVAYPRSRFAGDSNHGTGGVPALAIAGQLSDDLLTRLGEALAQTLVAGTTGARPPARLGIGVRVGRLASGTDPGGVTVDVGLRVDATRIPLLALADPDASPPPPARMAVEIRIDRPGGWLVDPAERPGVRVRRAELGVIVEVGEGAGPVQATAVFHDAAVDAPTTSRMTLADPAGPRLLGAVVAEAAAAGGEGGAALADALVTLGLAARDAAGSVTVVTDAVDAVQADPAAFLGRQARAAFAAGAGLFGVTGPSHGPWTASDPDLPLTVELAPDHLTVVLAALEVAGVVVSGELTWAAPAATPRISLTAAGVGASLRWDTAAGSLVLVPGPSADPVTLVPSPGGEALAARLGPMLVERLVAATAEAALVDRLGPGFQLGPLTELLTHPDHALLAPGTAGGAPQLDGDRIGGLLGLLGDLAGVGAGGGGTAGTGLTLPGGLVLRAGGQPCRLSLRTEPPFPVPGPGDGSLGALAVELDLVVPDLTTAPGLAGRLTLDVPLGGTWGGLGVTLGLDGGTVSLAVAPRAGDGSTLAPIVLLPRFGGLGPLAAGAAALLPALLDALEARLPQPHPAVADALLAIADAVGVHGGPGDPSFAAHTATIRALAGGDGLAVLSQANLPPAIVRLWQIAGLPGTVTATASGVSLAAGFDAVTVAVDAGWGATPTVRLRFGGLTAGPLALDPVEVGVAAGAITGGLTATVALPAAAEEHLGMRLTPSLRVTLDGDGPTVTVRPLGPGVDLVEAHILPTPGLVLADGGLAALLEQVVLPLAAQAVLDQVDLDSPLVAGGPSAADVLRAAGALATDAPRLAVPLPALADAVPNLLAALASTGASIRLGAALGLIAVADRSTTPARLGLGLHGHTGPAGEAVRVSVRLGEQAPTWLPDPAPALRLLLIEEGTWRLRPSLRLAPLGVRVDGPEDEALVDTEDVHLGAATAYLWADMNLDGGFTLGGIGGAVDFDDLGLPLGAVTAADGAGNPVAASLLGSAGDAGGAGDPRAVTPGISFVAARRPGSPFVLLRREDDRWLPFAERPVWFGVHRSFGPLALDQVGFAHVPAPAGSDRPGTAEVLVDGGVQVGPLTVQAHELGVGVPLDRLDQPGSWALDLGGLAVAFRSDAVALAGGLVKRPGPPLDYAGTVTVEVAGRTFTAVGAFGRPQDQQGAFTSLFVFVGLPMVIGGPPCLFVTGLGGGAGYNRRLVPPAAITDIPRFALVTAIDDGVNDDPAGTLARMGTAMPPQRGSLWLAAGLRFTSFSFVRSVGVLYVSLDRGVEIGLLGVARAEIPPPDAGAGSLELASVELALKARFSPPEGVLSIQAQLTDNSWLLSRDCQLTGGFAFFVWFRRDQFVLTLGGYHPSFVRPPEFPVVPRLGFHWAVSDAVVVKGEAYFALTSSCVMAGGRLEVAYNEAGVYASFTAYADFLIAWDPFQYDISVGVSVTAGFRIRVCLFACVTIDVRITLGASVDLLGPPLRGEATLDLEICSVTVAFGNQPHGPPTFMGWDAFRDKYVVAGATDGSALSMQATAGLIPPDGVSPAPAPGSRANPWRLAGNFSVRSETRLAATRYSVNGTAVAVPLNDGVQPVPATLDLGPMNVAGIASLHDLTVTSASPGAPPVDMSRLDVLPVVGHVPAAVWTITDQPAASAAVVPVLAGLVVSGQPQVADDQGRPPISVQVIDFNADPVPIGLVTPPPPPAPAPALVQALAELVTQASGPRLAAVGAEILGPGGGPARARAGLDPAPLGARGIRSLHARRSSPPLVATLAASLATEPRPATGAAPTSPAPGPAAAARSGGASRPRPAPLADVPRLRARLIAPAAPVPPPATDAGVTAGTAAQPAPATRAATTGSTLVAAELGSSTPGAPRAARQGTTLAAAGSPLAPGEIQIWDLPAPNDGRGWLVSGPGAARVVFLDRAGLPLQDDVVVPPAGEEVAVTAPPDAARVAFGVVGRPAADAAGRPVCGWQAGTLLAQVARATLLAPGASIHLPAPLVTRRDGLRTSQALVRAATAVAGAGAVETRLDPTVEVVVVIVDAPVEPDQGALPAVDLDGADIGEPAVVAAGHRLHLVYAIHGDPDRAALAVRVTVGVDWRLAGVLGGPGTVDDWMPAITGAGSGVAVATPAPASPVTVRHQAPTRREVS
jgi:large repetitive protein